MTRFIVTIAPPTPNGDLHLGHIAGPYLAGDVFARLQRQLGHEVTLVSYSDDYQSYLARKAFETGEQPLVLARKNGERINQTLQKIDIQLSHWLQSGNNPHFEAAVRYFYTAAQKDNSLSRASLKTAWFPQHQRYGYEAWARGKCNHCGVMSDASQCEACALPPDMTRMQEFRCILDKSKENTILKWQQVERDIFHIGNYREELHEIHTAFPMRKHLADWLGEIKDKKIDLNWPISRPGEHGVTLELPDKPIIHTWFSGIGGYLAATREMATSYEEADSIWQDPTSKLVHFIGFDCAFSHVMAYPSEMLATRNMTKNIQFYTNRFLTLSGEDFSTSRNHAIWVRDILETASSDAIRLYIARHAPEEEVSDFDLTAFNGWNKKWFDELLPLFMKTADRELTQTSGVSQSDTTQQKEYLAKWHELANTPLFSMRELAAFQIELLEIILDRHTQSRPVMDWMLLFGECGQALHPHLSQHLENRYLTVMVPGA